LSKSFQNAIVIASTVVNEDWIELFFLLDALRDAKNVILCVPYIGYSRQDVQNQNESFGSGLFSRFLETMNVSRCIFLDNHSKPTIRIPYIHLGADEIFKTDITSKYDASKITIVSPDIGGAYRANAISKTLKCDFALCNKAKDVFGELKKIDVVGNVVDKICIVVDDIIDSGATLCYAAEALLQAGCRGVAAYATHGILSKGSIEKLAKSSISEVTLTDSIFNNDIISSKIRKLSISSLIAETIRCIL
ncbi:MAG: ribose-phosphate diphosphokinase, partial [Holosporaceae bacterium]|nr:ribose-phosphate diphosphokinase [Holosporaceae bacterium]